MLRSLARWLSRDDSEQYESVRVVYGRCDRCAAALFSEERAEFGRCAGCEALAVDNPQFTLSSHQS